MKLFCVGRIQLANLYPTVAKWSLRILGIRVGSRITLLWFFEAYIFAHERVNVQTHKRG